MAKPDPAATSLPIIRQTTVEWGCPFCGRANGIPEITVCGCGAVRDGSRATSGHVGSATITVSDVPADSPSAPAK